MQRDRFENIWKHAKRYPSIPNPFQTSVCELPEVQGPCRDFLQRFRFDKDEGICKEFYYGGCEGNKNNFLTMDACKARYRYLLGTVPGFPPANEPFESPK